MHEALRGSGMGKLAGALRPHSVHPLQAGRPLLAAAWDALAGGVVMGGMQAG